MFRIELLVDARNELGEGALWDVEEQRLYWIDSHGGAIHRTDARGGGLRRWELPEHIGSMCLRAGGGAVVALRNGLHCFDFENGDLTPIEDPERDNRRTRMNDGKVDRQGRFLVGSMDYEEREPIGALYRLDPEHRLTRLEEGIIVSNGPCWSPDGGTFYFTDTWSGEISAYDYDQESGMVANKRCFCRMTSQGGAFDGATVDAEGCVWSAHVYAGRVVRYRPDGEVDRVIEMPVKKVTSVMFGGPGLDVLYVTSMAKPPLPRFPGDGVLRGSLFAIHDLGVRGVPEPRFAG
jgi:L-arabinonolactonase